MPKRTLECLIFFLLKKNGLLLGGDTRERAQHLGITESRYCSYLTESRSCFEKNANSRESVVQVLKKLQSDKDVTAEGEWFIFQEDDPLLRDDFKYEMEQRGFYTDTSFNRNIVKVKKIALINFIMNLNEKDSAEIGRQLVAELEKKNKENAREVAKYFESQKGWKEKVKDAWEILTETYQDPLKLLSAVARYAGNLLQAHIKTEKQ